MNDLAKKLQAHFPQEDIEWRAQQTGVDKNGNPWAMVLAYVTNRAIQSRLDSVFGPDGWGNKFKEGPLGGVICGISAAGVTKWDGADNTQVESIKGGLSDSMKRAGYQWGIGRYLYKLPTMFAECTTQRPKDRDDWNQAKVKNNNDYVTFYWKNPTLPDWALPGAEKF